MVELADPWVTYKNNMELLFTKAFSSIPVIEKNRLFQRRNVYFEVLWSSLYGIVMHHAANRLPNVVTMVVAFVQQQVTWIGPFNEMAVLICSK